MIPRFMPLHAYHATGGFINVMGRFRLHGEFHGESITYALRLYNDNGMPMYVPAHVRDMWIPFYVQSGGLSTMPVMIDGGMFKINFYDSTGVNKKMPLVER
jgi:hypothetical protein